MTHGELAANCNRDLAAAAPPVARFSLTWPSVAGSRTVASLAELRLIGSGIQVVADEHGSETWGNFPKERERLFRLVRDTKANGVIFLSGDRHLAEISRLGTDHKSGVGYRLFDITSSSLNAPSGNITKAKVRFANQINSYRVGLTYFEVNFGSIFINWDTKDSVIRCQVRDEQGAVMLQQRLSLSQLRGQMPRE